MPNYIAKFHELWITYAVNIDITNHLGTTRRHTPSLTPSELWGHRIPLIVDAMAQAESDSTISSLATRDIKARSILRKKLSYHGSRTLQSELIVKRPVLDPMPVDKWWEAVPKEVVQETSDHIVHAKETHRLDNLCEKKGSDSLRRNTWHHNSAFQGGLSLAWNQVLDDPDHGRQIQGSFPAFFNQTFPYIHLEYSLNRNSCLFPSLTSLVSSSGWNHIPPTRSSLVPSSLRSSTWNISSTVRKVPTNHSSAKEGSSPIRVASTVEFKPVRTTPHQSIIPARTSVTKTRTSLGTANQRETHTSDAIIPRRSNHSAVVKDCIPLHSAEIVVDGNERPAMDVLEENPAESFPNSIPERVVSPDVLRLTTPVWDRKYTFRISSSSTSLPRSSKKSRARSSKTQKRRHIITESGNSDDGMDEISPMSSAGPLNLGERDSELQILEHTLDGSLDPSGSPSILARDTSSLLSPRKKDQRKGTGPRLCGIGEGSLLCSPISTPFRRNRPSPEALLEEGLVRPRPYSPYTLSPDQGDARNGSKSNGILIGNGLMANNKGKLSPWAFSNIRRLLIKLDKSNNEFGEAGSDQPSSRSQANKSSRPTGARNPEDEPQPKH